MGYVEYQRFYEMLGEEKSLFIDQLFDLVEVETSNDALCYSEFVQAIATYCMFGTDEVLKFAYFIFDKDKNGFIEVEELTELVSVLHSNQEPSNVKMAMGKFDTNGDGRIDFDEFNKVHETFPRLLFPAFRMQRRMMELTHGVDFWEARRAKLREEAPVLTPKQMAEQRRRLEVQRRMGR